MFGGKRVRWWWFVGIGLGVWALAATTSDEPEVSTAESPTPALEPAREVPDEAIVNARKRRALASLLARRETSRAVTLTVRDCHRVAAAHAEVEIAAGDAHVAGRADAHGVFRADVPEGAREIVVSARGGVAPSGIEHRGTLARPGPAVEQVSGPIAIALSICPGATVLGTVRDEAGRPLSGAEVVLGEDIAVTEADGEFVLTDLWLEARQIVVTHAIGALERPIEPLAAGEERQLTLTLEEGRRVSGVVIDHGGQPVANATLTARDPAGEVLGQARSDRLGRFWLKRMPLSALRLVADGGRAGLGELTVAPNAAAESLVVRLAAQGVLVATWLGEPGAVLVATPDAAPWESPYLPEDNPHLRVLTSGREALVLAPRRWRVEVHQRDLISPCGGGLLMPGARLEVRCGGLGTAELVAEVVGEDGRPIAGGWNLDVDGRRALGELDAAGRLHARVELAFGAGADLVIGAPGYARHERRHLPLSPGTRLDLGRVVMISRATLADRFPDRDGTSPFGGIGARVQASTLGVALTAIARGGPLDLAGISAGDVVIAIDGTPAGYLSTGEAVKLLRGRPGSALELQLLRPDQSIFDVRIERALVDGGSAEWVD